MRQTGAVLFAGVLASSGVLAAGSLPRGVSPEFAAYYEDKSDFACIGNPTIVLAASQVNDGSCDCPDGSDEPGTPACAFINPLSPPQPLPGSDSGTANTTPALPGFWCANVGHIGAYVPFSFVNDGVCDYSLCCDGSEEYAHKGGVKCENRCVAIGKEYRRVEEERKKSRDRAAAHRHALATEARRQRNEVEERVRRAKDELTALERKREQLEKTLADTQRAERGKVVRGGVSGGGKAGGKLGTLVGLARQRVEELRQTLDKVLDQRDDLQERVATLENLLRNLRTQYNPNFNDEGVKAAVHAWDDYAAKAADEKKPEVEDVDVYAVLKEDSEENGINWKEFETDDATDTDILYSFEAYLPAAARAYIHNKVASIRSWLVENGILADNSNSDESPAVIAVRKNLDKVSADVTSHQNAISGDEADLARDYGADDVFRAVKDQCVSVDAGEYEYELCWMAQATQKSKKGHGNTSLGRFARIDWETADEDELADGTSLGSGPRMVLRYEDGQHCWNGPNRRVDVWLRCAEKPQLWRVTEAEKCVYRMEVGTPAACEGEDGSSAEAGLPAKDEL